jgi:hypothetical protein
MIDENKPTILICWNNDNSANYIENKIRNLNSYNIVLCSNFRDLDKIDYSKIIGIIVLCELKWSNEVNAGTYSDMNGIKLVQHYIRIEKKIKLPVLFLSFLGQRDIISKIKDESIKEIICTPILKHKFDRLPLCDSKIRDKMDDTGELSELELEYTIFRFCDIDGLIRHIKHKISTCYTIEDFHKLMNKLEYSIEKKYPISKSQLSDIKQQLLSMDMGNINDITRIKTLISSFCENILIPREL